MKEKEGIAGGIHAILRFRAANRTNRRPDPDFFAMTFTKVATRTWVFAFFAFIILSVAADTNARAYGSDYDVRRLLSEMKSVKNDPGKLATLFRVGDRHIPALLRALDDPDPEVSLRAQIVIRYLGNEVAVDGLFSWYAKVGRFGVAGPVPLPLREWDYNVISKQFLTSSERDWPRSEPYIYALALDGAPESQEMLAKLAEASSRLTDLAVARLAIKQIETNPPDKLPDERRADLAKLVRDKAFFLSSSDRKYTSTKFLAYNAGSDKALLEVRINRGILSEETYHVVLSKIHKGWKFFSVTPVSIS